MNEAIVVHTTAMAGRRWHDVPRARMPEMAARLRSSVRAQLGEECAALLARPSLRAGGVDVDWYASGDHIVPLDALDRDAAAALLAQAHAGLEQIAELAARLEQRGGAVGDLGALLAVVVEAAREAPVYSVDGRPVLAEWGIVPGEAPAAGRAAAARRAPAAGRAPASGEAPAAGGAVATGAADVADAAPAGAADGMAADAPPRPERRMRAPLSAVGAVRWLVLLAMFGALLALVWLARQPLEAREVVVERASKGLGDELAQAQAQRNALLARLDSMEDARAELERLCDSAVAARKPDSTPIVVPVPTPPAPPPVVGDPVPALPDPAPPPVVAEPEPPVAALPEPVPPAEPPAASPPEKLPFEDFLKRPLPQIARAPDPVAPSPTVPGAAPAKLHACRDRKAYDAPEVIVVVDASGSMRDPIAGASSRMEAAKRAISGTVRRLPKDVDVGLVKFSACDAVDVDRFFKSSERGTLLGIVDRLQPTRGTPLAAALRRAGSRIGPDTDNVILVVTDGGESCSGDPCAAAAALRASRPRTVVNVIDIGGGSSKASCLVQPSGGRVFRPGSAAEVQRMFSEATGEPDASACE